MADSVLVGQYVETHSIFHRLDPRTKLVSIGMLMLSFMMLGTGLSYVFATFLYWDCYYCLKFLCIFLARATAGIIYFIIYFCLQCRVHQGDDSLVMVFYRGD